MPATRTHFALAALAALSLGAQPATYAQSLMLNSGDFVTVNGAGTQGTIGGVPVANTTKSYSDSGSFYAVETTGTAAFTLSTGGTITAGDNHAGLYANGSGPIAVTGGTITAGAGSEGLYVRGSGLITISGGTFTAGQGGDGLVAISTSSSPVTITGGTFTGGNDGYGLFADSSIDLYGAFDGLTLGQTQSLPGGAGSFVGTLENNTAAQTFTYFNNGTITLHDVTPAAAPEPSQFAAFVVGLLGLGALALRARKRQAV